MDEHEGVLAGPMKTARLAAEAKQAREWRSRCDWCGWPLVPHGEAGCWDGNCSMRPMPTLNAAQREVVELKQTIRRLERELADAQDDVKRLHSEKMDLWEKLHFPQPPTEDSK